jgi:hypothetical protein
VHTLPQGRHLRPASAAAAEALATAVSACVGEQEGVGNVLSVELSLLAVQGR